ncbi:MAG TPA: serine hydrolase domain-containing protein, partial [Bryobacterales bacterium]|nr:serine hydrolase domain-containing protein [Bryobacterales bacterium]
MQRTDKHNATPQGKRAARALLLAALLLAARPALAAAGAVLQKGSPDSVGVSPGRLASALTRMAELVDADVMAGAVVLVARNGVIVAEQAFGLADVENSIPFRNDTICAMASVTKPVTATAVMILAGQGKLNIDDPVEKYLPAFGSQQLVVDGQPRGHRAITLRQLLTHTSGLPQDVPSRKLPYMDRGWLSRTLPSIADEAAKMDLRFEPGTRYSYSSAGVAVLGRTVEVVSGQPFDAFQKTRLFGPLGMADTSFQPPASAAGRVAVLYADRDGKREAYYRFDPAFRITNPAPNGGLFSTARDMAAFVQMYLNRGEYNGVQVLGSGEVRLMLSDQTPQLPQMRGLGW